MTDTDFDALVREAPYDAVSASLLIAHARECREALRAVLDDDVSCVPEVGQCEYTWTVGEFCGSKTVPGTYLCERHAGQERGAAHGSYEIHRAARRCLEGGT